MSVLRWKLSVCVACLTGGAAIAAPPPAVPPPAAPAPAAPDKVALATRIPAVDASTKALAPPRAPAAAAPAPLTATPNRVGPGAPVDDVWARPFFVKGDLSAFTVRPLTRRNFVGVGAGINAVPGGVDTALNAFFFTVEPQLDIANPTYNWKLGLGAPLQFQLIDTRGAFEICVGEGRVARTMGGSEGAVAAQTGVCVARQKERVTEGFGRLRHQDWDEASDFAKIIRYMVIGGQEQPFYLNVSRLYDQTFGHGTVVRQYNPNIDYNTARVGVTVDFNRQAIGIQAMANDLVRPDVLGLMMFLRPFRPTSESAFWRSVSLGVSWVHGVNVPRSVRYEQGLYTRSFDEPIPSVDSELNPVGGAYEQLKIVGVDLEAKVVRTQNADGKLYLDYQKMVGFGGGITMGSLWRLSFGRPAWQALRIRAELHSFDPDYLPSFFDTFHDIFQYQYLPVGYQGSNGLTYHPTKLGFLDANRKGRRRVGGYLELQHSFLDVMTLGATWRTWAPYGQPKDPGFVAPEFPDFGRGCGNNDGILNCGATVAFDKDIGFTSMKVHAELPFRKFLQAFVAYEVFSTTTEPSLGVLRFDGDNEILFSGLRMQLLPILFIEAQARRYFFLQRLNNVNLQELTLEQDQNFHSKWTFGLSAYVGYEF